MSINWKRYTLGALLLAAFALLLFGCSGGSNGSGATKSISGVVSDPETGLPVANAKVAAYGVDANGVEATSALSGSASTDDNGAYTVQIPQSYNGSVIIEATVSGSSVLRQLRQLVTASGPTKIRSAVPQSEIAQATIPPVMVSLATDAAFEFVRQNYATAGLFSSDNVRKANSVLESLFGANFTQTPPPAGATDTNTSKAQQDLIVSIKALNLVLAADSSKTVAVIVASMADTNGMKDIADDIKNGIAQATAALSAAGTLPAEYQPSAAINTALSNAQNAPVPVPDLSDVTAPSAPLNPTATAAAARKVVLSWSAATDDTGVVGYAICRAEGTGVYAVIDTVNAAGSSAASFSYIDLHVAPQKAYSYRILAFDKARNHSLPSSAVTVTTPAALDAIAPAKPAGFVCKGFTAAQVNLQWQQSSKANVDGSSTPAASYNVYRDYQLIATVTETSFVDRSVAAGTVYTYYVKASDTNGNLSAASALLNVRTAADSTATQPAAATALVLNSAATLFKAPLAWTASTSAGVTYNVYRDSQLIASGIAAAAYTDASVLPNSSYSYTVTAVSGSAESVASNALSVTTPADPKATDTAAPTMPTNLVALSATSGSVSLAWGPSFKLSGDQIVAGYVIMRGDASAKNFVKVGVVKTPGFTDTTVSPSTTYSYQVRSFSLSGAVSAPSVTWIVATPGAVDVTDSTPPTVPTDLGLAADPTSGSVPLKWTASTKTTGDKVVAGYLIYRNGVQIADVKGAAAFTDNSVASGTTYTYAVKAYDNPGNISAASTGFTVATPAAIPGTYNIYGSVVINGAGLPGVTVTMTSGTGATSTAVTDSNGNYSFTGVADNTRYTLTAAATGYYDFTPPTRSFVVNGASVSGQVFSATLQGAINGGTNYPDGIIIGGVTYPGGTVIGGVLFPTGTVIGGISYPAGSIVGGIAFPNGAITGSTSFPTGGVSGSTGYPTGGISGGILFPTGILGGAILYPTGTVTGTLSW
jgi:fibronectin type 3 domain-containing protein